MADVYLSFSPEDRATAARVRALLEAAGLEVLPALPLRASDGEVRPPDAARDACRRVVVLWSRHGVTDPGVITDADAARATGRLLPVLIERVEPPAAFRDLLPVDLSEGAATPPFAARVARLLDALAYGLPDAVPGVLGPPRGAGLLGGIVRTLRRTIDPLLPRRRGSRHPDPRHRGRETPGIRGDTADGRDRRTGIPGARERPSAPGSTPPPGHVAAPPPPPAPGPAPGAAEARAPATTDEAAEPVLLGVAAPRRARAGDTFTANFAAYIAVARASVRDKLEALGEPDDRIVLDLAPDRDARWRVGAPVSVRVTCEHARVTPAERRFEWNGRENLAGFAVAIDPDAPQGTLVLAFHVFLASVPIAFVPLRVAIGAAAHAGKPDRAEVAAPASAFASYASADAEAVTRSLSTLAHWSPRLDIFQDCLDLTPNESYKPQLATQIAARDVFLLFWSRHAAASRWVAWEYETARVRKGVDAILPMPLEDPSIAAPPPELADRHLRDRFLIAGYALRKIAELRDSAA